MNDSEGGAPSAVSSTISHLCQHPSVIKSLCRTLPHQQTDREKYIVLARLCISSFTRLTIHTPPPPLNETPTYTHTKIRTHTIINLPKLTHVYPSIHHPCHTPANISPPSPCIMMRLNHPFIHTSLHPLTPSPPPFSFLRDGLAILPPAPSADELSLETSSALYPFQEEWSSCVHSANTNIHACARQCTNKNCLQLFGWRFTQLLFKTKTHKLTQVANKLVQRIRVLLLFFILTRKNRIFFFFFLPKILI